MPPFGAGVTVTVHRPFSVDVYGDRGIDTTHTIARCALAPVTSSEVIDRGTTVQTLMTLYAPAGSDLRAADRVTVGGRTYEVVGDPAEWANPFTGRRPGLSADLRAVRG